MTEDEKRAEDRNLYDCGYDEGYKQATRTRLRIESQGGEPTLRDRFAMAALAGGSQGYHSPSAYAAQCYRYADAMLEAR